MWGRVYIGRNVPRLFVCVAFCLGHLVLTCALDDASTQSTEKGEENSKRDHVYTEHGLGYAEDHGTHGHVHGDIHNHLHGHGLTHGLGFAHGHDLGHAHVDGDDDHARHAAHIVGGIEENDDHEHGGGAEKFSASTDLHAVHVATPETFIEDHTNIRQKPQHAQVSHPHSHHHGHHFATFKKTHVPHEDHKLVKRYGIWGQGGHGGGGDRGGDESHYDDHHHDDHVHHEHRYYHHDTNSHRYKTVYHRPDIRIKQPPHVIPRPDVVMHRPPIVMHRRPLVYHQSPIIVHKPSTIVHQSPIVVHPVAHHNRVVTHNMHDYRIEPRYSGQENAGDNAPTEGEEESCGCVGQPNCACAPCACVGQPMCACAQKRSDVPHVDESDSDALAKRDVVVRRPPVIYHPPPEIYHRPDIVVHRSPLLVHRPSIIYHQPPVVVHRPAVVYRQPPLVFHQPPPAVNQPLLYSHDKYLQRQSSHLEHIGSELENSEECGCLDQPVCECAKKKRSGVPHNDESDASTEVAKTTPVIYNPSTEMFERKKRSLEKVASTKKKLSKSLFRRKRCECNCAQPVVLVPVHGNCDCAAECGNGGGGGGGGGGGDGGDGGGDGGGDPEGEGQHTVEDEGGDEEFHTKMIQRPDKIFHQQPEVINRPDIIVHRPDVVINRHPIVVHRPPIVVHKPDLIIKQAPVVFEHTAPSMHHSYEHHEDHSDGCGEGGCHGGSRGGGRRDETPSVDENKHFFRSQIPTKPI